MASPTLDQNLIFHPADEADLSSRNRIAYVKPGLARINRDRFTGYSFDEADQGSASSTSNQVDEADIEVPTHLESAQTYCFLGFTPVKAELIWSRYSNLSPTLRQFGSFFDACQIYIEYTGDDAESDSEDWVAYLNELGINQRTIDAIMKPENEDIRLTRSAEEWIKFATKTRFEFLVGGQSYSWNRGSAIERRRGDASTDASLTSHMPRVPSSQESQSTVAESSGRPLAPASEETVLWKAVSRDQGEDMWDWSQRGGPFNLHRLDSAQPLDLGPRCMVYFTPQIRAAQLYANYITAIADTASICLVRLEIPNSLIERYNAVRIHFPTDDFKKTVFYCRNRESLKGKVDAVRNTDVVISDTCKCKDRTFAKMKDWSEVTEQHLVILDDGERMIQFAFGAGSDFEDEVLDTCQQRISLRDLGEPSIILGPEHP